MCYVPSPRPSRYAVLSFSLTRGRRCDRLMADRFLLFFTAFPRSLLLYPFFGRGMQLRMAAGRLLRFVMSGEVIARYCFLSHRPSLSLKLIFGRYLITTLKMGANMPYCPSTDIVTQNIKRANEKAKKNRALDKSYRTSKSRNQYSVGICLKQGCMNVGNCNDCIAFDHYASSGAA